MCQHGTNAVTITPSNLRVASGTVILNAICVRNRNINI